MFYDKYSNLLLNLNVITAPNIQRISILEQSYSETSEQTKTSNFADVIFALNSFYHLFVLE